MPSYEKQAVVGHQFGDGVNSFSKPPEVLVCMDCGALVWPTRVALHDRWHQSLDSLKRAKTYQDYANPYPQQRRRPGSQ